MAGSITWPRGPNFCFTPKGRRVALLVVVPIAVFRRSPYDDYRYERRNHLPNNMDLPAILRLWAMFLWPQTKTSIIYYFNPFQDQKHALVLIESKLD